MQKYERKVHEGNFKLNWADKFKIKTYAAVIYGAVRVGGGFSINKSEYPDENVVRL